FLTRSSSFILFPDCYPATRDLHSFPTRRSSDLHHSSIDLVDRLGDLRAPSLVRRRGQLPFELRARQPQRFERSSFLRILTATTQDRKSTRLNSSHVAISYAVFCLKKKTHSPSLQ